MVHQSTQHTDHRVETEQRPFWKSRNGRYMLAALAGGGLILGIEYRDVILNSNLFVWLPFLLCVGMHFFMHGGHGGHGSGGDKS
ncbi:DUF2933 domain-containing protein [Tropicimonas marinistellae]|uniref:DUF2933 domain-containing protein n=1 Tax=Tropicimonas marinistellae TaxID=1739787 RepID=UPI001F3B3973|nr:DUF2933 domain-containing protein [Tropicimonas marinistellae]